MSSKVRLHLVLVAVALAGLSTQAAADSVTIGQTITLRETTGVAGGGPFLVDQSGTVDDFLTFCLEYNQIFVFGEDVKVVDLSNEARTGGVAGQDSATGDSLSSETAFVYTQFRSSTPNPFNLAVGADVQNLIWCLETEMDCSALVIGTGAASLYSGLGAAMSSAGWPAGSTGNVRVMNLMRGPSFDLQAQDMLVLDPDPDPDPNDPNLVPEPTSLLLLGTGFLGLAVAARRARRARR